MSSGSYSTSCSNCLGEIEITESTRPYIQIEGECKHCGFCLSTKQTQMSLLELNELREHYNWENGYSRDSDDYLHPLQSLPKLKPYFSSYNLDEFDWTSEKENEPFKLVVTYSNISKDAIKHIKKILNSDIDKNTSIEFDTYFQETNERVTLCEDIEKIEEQELKEWNNSGYIEDDNYCSHGEGTEGRLETFGEELETVLKINKDSPRKLWTVTEDEGNLYISAGYHLFNRLYYIVTENEWNSEDESYIYFLTEDHSEIEDNTCFNISINNIEKEMIKESINTVNELGNDFSNSYGEANINTLISKLI